VSLIPVAAGFRRLLTVVLIAGTTAGLLLAALQLVALVPLIHTAETYEQAEHSSVAHAAHGEQGWQPSDGLERTMYTVLGTTLTGIAFSALLFGGASLLGLNLDVRRGLWLGLAGFLCCTLAPALGLPPRPPGVPGAPLHAAQVWWCATALATAVGLWAMTHAEGKWAWRVAGVVCLLAPHVLGAPTATGVSSLPSELTRQFALVSIATQATFWLLLGGLGSHLYVIALGDSRPTNARPYW
jgi:cobalt transporter subunit CbtA